MESLTCKVLQQTEFDLKEKNKKVESIGNLHLFLFYLITIIIKEELTHPKW